MSLCADCPDDVVGSMVLISQPIITLLKVRNIITANVDTCFIYQSVNKASISELLSTAMNVARTLVCYRKCDRTDTEGDTRIATGVRRLNSKNSHTRYNILTGKILVSSKIYFVSHVYNIKPIGVF